MKDKSWIDWFLCAALAAATIFGIVMSFCR